MGFRPRLRERGTSFRYKRVGFWLRFREREKVGVSAKVERERAGFFGLRELGFG